MAASSETARHWFVYDRAKHRYRRMVDIVLPPGLKPVTITKVRIGQFCSDARPKHIRNWQPR